mgnify:CR=1 FL=1
MGISIEGFISNKSNILICVKIITLGRTKPMIVEEVKDELKKLCTDYLNILQELKKKEIISPLLKLLEK